jgi:hypothetical protein
MPELFRASSNQLPSVGILPYERAAVERVYCVPDAAVRHIRRTAPSLGPGINRWGRPCPLPGMPIRMVSGMCPNKIDSSQCLYGTRRSEMVPGSMGPEQSRQHTAPKAGISAVHLFLHQQGSARRFRLESTAIRDLRRQK